MHPMLGPSLRPIPPLRHGRKSQRRTQWNADGQARGTNGVAQPTTSHPPCATQARVPRPKIAPPAPHGICSSNRMRPSTPAPQPVLAAPPRRSNVQERQCCRRAPPLPLPESQNFPPKQIHPAPPLMPICAQSKGKARVDRPRSGLIDAKRKYGLARLGSWILLCEARHLSQRSRCAP